MTTQDDAQGNEVTLSSATVLLRGDVSVRRVTELHLSSMPIQSIGELGEVKTLKRLSLTSIPVVEISPLLALQSLDEVTFIHVPARADVIVELQRRGVKVTND